jgi:hypothetical protein
MKKIFVFVAVCVVAFSISALAAKQTLTGQDATKTGLASLVSKVNANFTEVYEGVGLTNVNDRLALCLTNATVTAQTKTITYAGVDGSTNTLAVCTNVTITIVR